MRSIRSWSVRTTLVVLICVGVGLALIPSADAQTYTLTNNTNPCLSTTMKYYFGGMTSPSSIIILKMFTGSFMIHKTMETNAVCNGNITMTFQGTSLSAQVFGVNLTMFPHQCGWTATGCTGPLSTTDSDGLPVELMGFEVSDTIEPRPIRAPNSEGEEEPTKR